MSVRLGLMCAIPTMVVAVAGTYIATSGVPTATPTCLAVANAARSAAVATGEPTPLVGVGPGGVLIVFQKYHLLMSSLAHDIDIAQKLGGHKLGECTHDDETRSVWSVPGLPPGFPPTKEESQ